MPSLTCSKVFADFPFAHRQPSHDGHCRFVHGHNWTFVFTFAAKEHDACGFVVDFGKLGPLKEWLKSMFDHTLVLSPADPQSHRLTELEREGLADVVFVPDPSCEGLAALVLEMGQDIVDRMTDGRVAVVRVEVFEDQKNSAAAEAAAPWEVGAA